MDHILRPTLFGDSIEYLCYIKTMETIGDLEKKVMAGIILSNNLANANKIRESIETHTGDIYGASTIHTVVSRLEKKHYICLVGPIKQKTLSYKITSIGKRILKRSMNKLRLMGL